MSSDYEAITLYPGAAPGSESWTHDEQEHYAKSFEDDVCINVSRPTLLVVRPAPGTANGTAIVVCPGGGFHGLSMGFEGHRVAEWLAARGVTCFILKYRLIHIEGMEPGDAMRARPRADFMRDITAVVPLAADDGRTAIALIRSRASEFGVDPAKVGIIGFSAGGTVAASVAFNDDPASRPDFVAPIYLQYDWVVKAGAPSVPMPMFLACATNDDVGLAPHSVRLYQDWVGAGQSAELHMYSTGGHGFGMRERGVPSDGWIDAFAAWLKVRGLLPTSSTAPS